MAKHGKKYRDAAEKIDEAKEYSTNEAIALLKEIAPANFDETVELHIRTGLDTRHADQQLRGTIVLPHGLGKSQRVLVFADGEAARLAEDADADEVGGDALVKKVGDGYLDFDGGVPSTVEDLTGVNISNRTHDLAFRSIRPGG